MTFFRAYLVTILKALISTLSSNREINIYSSVADLNAQFIYSKWQSDKGGLISEKVFRFAQISKQRFQSTFPLVQSALQNHPCNENRVFPVYFFSQGKTCTGLQCAKESDLALYFEIWAKVKNCKNKPPLLHLNPHLFEQ